VGDVGVYEGKYQRETCRCDESCPKMLRRKGSCEALSSSLDSYAWVSPRFGQLLLLVPGHLNLSRVVIILHTVLLLFAYQILILVLTRSGSFKRGV